MDIWGDYDQWATDYQVQVAMTVLDEVQEELAIDPDRFAALEPDSQTFACEFNRIPHI